jgi:hypothetical protein
MFEPNDRRLDPIEIDHFDDFRIVALDIDLKVVNVCDAMQLEQFIQCDAVNSLSNHVFGIGACSEVVRWIHRRDPFSPVRKTFGF